MKAVHEEIRPGHRLTTLGWLPENWIVDELGNTCELIRDGTHLPPERSKEGPLLLSIQNLIGGYLRETKDDTRVPWDFYNTMHKNWKPEVGDVLLAVVGATIGKTAHVPADFPVFTLQRSITVLRGTSHRLSNTYLRAFLDSNIFTKQMWMRANQTAQPGIYLAEINKIKIPIPPFLEQTAIANVLSTWDRAITHTTQLIAQKELRKKWLMRQLLTGKKRLRGFKTEWSLARLSDIFVRVTRKNAESNTNVVTISAQRGFIKQEDFFNKIVASEITENYFLVERGEFCYNKSYSNGYPWGATKRLNDFDKAVVTTLYICFGIKDQTETSGDFFEQYFESGSLDKGLMKIAHEGGRAHGLLNVTPSDFFELKIHVPQFMEQQAIATVLHTADKELGLLRQKLDKLKEQKKGLMQILLTGKKRLKI